MKQLAAIGEVMLELAPAASGADGRELKALSYAGDTYNTAVYLARLGIATGYVTRLGDDPYSGQLLERMAAEGLDTGLVEQVPGRVPGLYMIRNTPDGERSFCYWRGESPARELFARAEDSRRLLEALRAVDCVYFSGITLAILGETGRQQLLDTVDALRREGITLAFDSNYRPALWPDREEARRSIGAAMARTDIALLTEDDERLLWDEGGAAACQQRYPHINELVLKRGAEDAIIVHEGRQVAVPVPSVSDVVDTTGAGDTFNAGYLAARLQGADPASAAEQGIRCAGIGIRHRGGVIERETFLQAL